MKLAILTSRHIEVLCFVAEQFHARNATSESIFPDAVPWCMARDVTARFASELVNDLTQAGYIVLTSTSERGLCALAAPAVEFLAAYDTPFETAQQAAAPLTRRQVCEALAKLWPHHIDVSECAKFYTYTHHRDARIDEEVCIYLAELPGGCETAFFRAATLAEAFERAKAAIEALKGPKEPALPAGPVYRVSYLLASASDDFSFSPEGARRLAADVLAGTPFLCHPGDVDGAEEIRREDDNTTLGRIRRVSMPSRTQRMVALERDRAMLDTTGHRDTLKLAEGDGFAVDGVIHAIHYTAVSELMAAGRLQVIDGHFRTI